MKHSPSRFPPTTNAGKTCQFCEKPSCENGIEHQKKLGRSTDRAVKFFSTGIAHLMRLVELNAMECLTRDTENCSRKWYLRTKLKSHSQTRIVAFLESTRSFLQRHILL